eukprot:15479299-Alexandrium_andersonii.AAC.1
MNLRAPARASPPCWAPLHFLRHGKDRFDQKPQLVKSMVEKQADIELRNGAGLSPLHAAAGSGSFEVVAA